MLDALNASVSRHVRHENLVKLELQKVGLMLDEALPPVIGME